MRPAKSVTSRTLYRRLPMDWWHASVKRGTLNQLPVSRFRPNANDVNGLSVSQEGVSTIEIASATAKGKRDCVAEFPTVAATDRGLSVVSEPTTRDPGHAVILEMNYAAFQDPVTENIVDEHAHALARASKVVWPTEADPHPQA